MKQIKVLFVCLGNICRSPAAEAVFKQYVEQQSLSEQFYIDSAGTIGHHAGHAADARMRSAGKQRGYHLDSLSRKVMASDMSEFDLVVAMDSENLDDLQALVSEPSAHLLLLGRFLPEHNDTNAPDVPDPYYGGAAGFEQVLDMLEMACAEMLDYCQSNF